MPPRKRTQPASPESGSSSTQAADPNQHRGHPLYTYQQKFTRCHKPACRRCASGPGHGPYWYAFWWEGGRTRSRYLGKEPPAALAGTLPAPAAAPPALRVVMLGRFAVWRDGALLPETAWPRRKALALFKLVLSVPGHRLLRDQALDALWPDEDPELSGAALRNVAHGVRRALGLSSGLALRDGVLALDEQVQLQVDAETFAAAATAALAGRDVEACRAALALYGGDYLPDDLYEEWAMRRREELAALRASLLLHRAQLCAEAGDLAEACAALSVVLAADSAHEDAAYRLMMLLAAMGRRAEALRVYARLRAALREQYALEPGEDVAALAMRLHAQQAARAPRRPPDPAPARPTNLPTGQSSFVGRQDAQDAVRGLLAAHRLVTLVGPGGSGKTRLAMRVAESLLDDYPDGVWLCELAGLARADDPGAQLSAPDAVARAVAGALALPEDAHCAPRDAICAFLAERRLLLVLDNCEHVLDPVARLVAAILARVQAVRILTTSQEAIAHPAELVWTVPPLALPAPGQNCSPDCLGAYDAIQLFVERARAARPGFALTDATAPLVLEICRRLDGVPLALELAAARLAFLPLPELAARLDDRFHVLVGGSRAALPRHQTLRATMDWSYSLLGERERALLRRLSLFAGGWTLAAAEGICDDAALPRQAILDTLGGLVAKSLVTVQGDDASLRHGMLETVRQYGRALLLEQQEEAAIHARHLAWYARHCEEEIAGWSSGDQAALLRRLDAELENIRTALAWGLGTDGDAGTALRLTSALSRYWTMRGLAGEGRRWTARALDVAPAAPAALRATALNRCAILARMEGDGAAAGRYWEASLALFRTLDDLEGIARVVGNLGLLYYDLDDDAAAIAALTESLDLYRRHGNTWGVARNLLNAGMVYTRQRQFAAAEEAFAEAAALRQAMGDQAGLGIAYLHMAELAHAQEHFEQATALYTESLRIALALDDRTHVPAALDGVARVMLRQCTKGVRDRAALECIVQIFACAATLRENTGVPVSTADRRAYHADLQLLHTLLSSASFEAAWAAGRALSVVALIERLPVWTGGSSRQCSA